MFATEETKHEAVWSQHGAIHSTGSRFAENGIATPQLQQFPMKLVNLTMLLALGEIEFAPVERILGTWVD